MNTLKRSYTVYQINSFTEQKFSGNPAGVVLNAEGLSDPEMLLIARELKNSETAFLFYPDQQDIYDVEIRFFTPTTEVPICGHATIAAHYVRAIENHFPAELTCVQKTKAGLLPIAVIRDGEKISIKMTQGAIHFQPIDRYYQKLILDALGLSDNDLLKNYPVEIASTGHSKVMVGIKSKFKLNELRPDLVALTGISSNIKCNGFFVFTVDDKGQQFYTDGRMFAPAIGIDEDPVTGNANGPPGSLSCQK